MSITLLSLGLLGFYIGKGLGDGLKMSNKIKNKEIVFEDRISFTNGQTDTVFIVGKNSTFLFYLQKDKSELEITPINSGVLKSIVEKSEFLE